MPTPNLDFYPVQQTGLATMASDDASTAEYAEVPLPEPSELAGSASEGDKKKLIDLLGIFTRRGQFSMPIGKRIKLVRVDVQPNRTSRESSR